VFGPQQPVDDLCNAVLQIGDDYGDNVATFLCKQPPNHAGKHSETYNAGTEEEPNMVTVTWQQDKNQVP
jgi:hypothetical protein